VPPSYHGKDNAAVVLRRSGISEGISVAAVVQYVSLRSFREGTSKNNERRVDISRVKPKRDNAFEQRQGYAKRSTNPTIAAFRQPLSKFGETLAKLLFPPSPSFSGVNPNDSHLATGAQARSSRALNIMLCSNYPLDERPSRTRLGDVKEPGNAGKAEQFPRGCSGGISQRNAVGKSYDVIQPQSNLTTPFPAWQRDPSQTQ